TPGSGFASVWGTAPNDVWAAGAKGLLRYDGTTWTDVTPLGSSPPLASVWGSGPRDVWTGDAVGRIFLYDGSGWIVVRSPPMASSLPAAGGTGRHVYMWGAPALDRAVPWSCAPSEIQCGDAVDNDCDGKIDEQDPDCRAAIALGEISSGTPRYIEIANRAGE